jgi:hypothetical protein
MPQVYAKGTFLSGWRMFGASHQGLDHLERRLPCQDAFEYGASDHLIWIAVADGLGGERQSDFGAQFVVNQISALIRNSLTNQSAQTEEDLQRMFEHCRELLLHQANVSHCDAREFSTTLQLVLINTKDGILHYAAVGDGHCIISLQNRECRVLGDQRVRPSIGIAHLLYDRSDKYTHVESVPLDAIDGIFVFTDGLDKLFLQRRTAANIGKRVNVDAIATLNEIIIRAEDETRGVFVLNTLVSARQHDALTDDKTLVTAIRMRENLPLSPQPTLIKSVTSNGHGRSTEGYVGRAEIKTPLRDPNLERRTSHVVILLKRFHRSAVSIWLPWLQIFFLVAILSILLVDKVNLTHYFSHFFSSSPKKTKIQSTPPIVQPSP